MKFKFKPTLIFFFILLLINYKSWASITVNGDAVVKAAPDQAQFSINIENQDVTAKQAASANAKQANKVIKLLKQLVPEKDGVTTQNYNIYPDYKYDSKKQSSKLVGYKVSNQINVKTKDINNIGNLLDKVTNAGVSSINNLIFAVEDNSELYKQALEKAVAVATERATVLAKAANIKLGKVNDIKSGMLQQEPIPRPMNFRMASAEVNVMTPIQTGSVSTRAAVTVEFKTE